MKAFVDFYKQEKISPVSQDISDLERHYRRRSALYRHLGVAPNCVRGKSVLEFGPGSGHNSIHTASLGPGRYKLVEGNPTGIESVEALFAEHVENPDTTEIVESLIENFEDDSLYDLVLCEGLLPLQEDPIGVMQHAARFTAPGGLLVVTCTDSVSYLAELLRKLFAYVLTGVDDSTDRKLEILMPVFSPQLSRIEGMSRPHPEYILDNIIQPFAGRRLFGMNDAIEAVSESHSFFGVSPDFYTDWRWYKKVTGPTSEFNERGLEGYFGNVHNLLDSRTEPTPGDAVKNRELLNHCDQIYEEILGYEVDRSEARLDSVVLLLDRVFGSQWTWDELTKASIARFTENLEKARSGERDLSWEPFDSWFGQAQLYVSLIRES